MEVGVASAVTTPATDVARVLTIAAASAVRATDLPVVRAALAVDSAGLAITGLLGVLALAGAGAAATAAAAAAAAAAASPSLGRLSLTWAHLHQWERLSHWAQRSQRTSGTPFGAGRGAL